MEIPERRDATRAQTLPRAETQPTSMKAECCRGHRRGSGVGQARSSEFSENSQENHQGAPDGEIDCGGDLPSCQSVHPTLGTLQTLTTQSRQRERLRCSFSTLLSDARRDRQIATAMQMINRDRTENPSAASTETHRRRKRREITSTSDTPAKEAV
ncbi:hypothetical protein TGMAS_357530 [Toxoplasma gondii MAS]|uniref:Uncharacterized protein n=1 Tax=Toxoplasma gondii MAS TaxID=943118 RepID=A0A086PPJ8_TOXGO|nr:hypothetical protein TGMAS_357530 [Toxoplasma gondii MAS]